MAIYSINRRTTSVVNNTAGVEFIAGPDRGFRLLEMGWTNTSGAGSAGACGFGRPAAKGITPTSPVTLLAEDFNNTTASTVTSATAWGTEPTKPTDFFRRWGFSAASGNGHGFSPTYGRGMSVLKTETLVYWMIVTSAALFYDVWLVVDE